MVQSHAQARVFRVKRGTFRLLVRILSNQYKHYDVAYHFYRPVRVIHPHHYLRRGTSQMVQSHAQARITHNLRK